MLSPTSFVYSAPAELWAEALRFFSTRPDSPLSDLGSASGFELRVELLKAAMPRWGLCNAFVFRPELLDDDPSVAAVLGRRAGSLAVAPPARARVLASLGRRAGRAGMSSHRLPGGPAAGARF